MDKKTFQSIEEHMHACMKDSAHDQEHVYRVLYAALDIARYETAVDLDILTAACLLHDIGREDQFQNPSVCHAEAGSERAYLFLTGLGWAQAPSAHVRACVLTHRYRTDRRPMTREAKILFDADKLDVTGSIGIARTLTFGGQIGQPLYYLSPEGQILTDPHTAPSFLREFNYKLRNIEDGLYTARARSIAAERRPSALAFYDSLLEELSDCYVNGKKVLRDCMEEKP